MTQTPPNSGAPNQRRRRVDRLHAETAASRQPSAPAQRTSAPDQSRSARRAAPRKPAPGENPYPHLRSYQPQPQRTHHLHQHLHQHLHHAARREQQPPHRTPSEHASLPYQGYVPSSRQPMTAKPPERRAANQASRPASRTAPRTAPRPASAPSARAGAKPAAGRVLPTRILLLVCACVFAVSAFLLIRYFVNIAITRKASSELEAAYSAALQNTESPTATPGLTPTPAPTDVPFAQTEQPARAAAQPTIAPASASQPSALELWPTKYPLNPTLRVSTVFYEMQRKNKDIIGWLKIDGVLEEAVLQRDNEFYLTHNALGQRSVTGALFLDETCDLKTVPTQMLIHGHNMKEGAMFGSLKKYKVKDASFYRSHPFIDFNTIYENGRYVIFAVAEVDIRWDRADYLPFWQDMRFSSSEAFMNYVNKARTLSHYRCNVDVQPGDRLLTLSTCEGSDDNKRLIVMARKLRDGENELELNMSIMSTYDR